MKTIRRTMDVDGYQNVQKLVSEELKKWNREKYKLVAVAYGPYGPRKENKLIMDFVAVNKNEAVRNFVQQMNIEQHSGVQPEKYVEDVKCKGQKYIGYVCPEPKKVNLLFFA